ncbi:MAG: VOC family protein [Alphaproteobacteria bacterium]|nr:VOC family protein [Alphaproteobacteria bacterium]
MAISRRGLHHLALSTSNMDKTVRFWTEVLECPIIVTLHLPPEDPFADLPQLPPTDLGNRKHYFFDIGNGDAVAFFDFGSETPPVDGGFAHHVALTCATEDELIATKKHLESHGVDVSEVINHFFCKSIYFKDPNGIYLEYSVHTGEWTAANPFLQDADPVPAARDHLGTKQEERLLDFQAGIPETYGRAS